LRSRFETGSASRKLFSDCIFARIEAPFLALVATLAHPVTFLASASYRTDLVGDDASMLRHVMAFPVTWPGVRTLGKKPRGPSRRVSAASVVPRIMLLDVVLGRPGTVWLAGGSGSEPSDDPTAGTQQMVVPPATICLTAPGSVR
jgi:hypothetical protein